MITTELNRVEFTADSSGATEYVFRTSGGTAIPVKNQAHIKVYLTNTGTFTANSSTNVFTNVTLNGSAEVNHGHLNTEIIRVSAATTLPAGLIINTDYYVRDKDPDEFKLALASGDSAVPITTTGTGTLTWTKTLLQIIATHYTVVISGTTATVTFLVAPPNTVKILLLREVPFEQNTDLLNNSLIEAESLESQLDLIVNQTQQLKNQTARDLRLSNNLTATDATETAVTLNVTSANRASKSLKFDASGNLAVTDIDIDLSQDYTLESKSWATESPDAVNTYDGSVASSVSPTAYSSKEHAVGDATPSAKNYATKVDGGIPTATSDHSAKAWSVGGIGVTTTSAKGAAKEWASGSGLIDTASYSSKEYAQSATAGTATYAGSSKGWASTAYGAAVPGAGSGDRSSLHYSTDASNSALAARASAAAVSQTYDNFSDVYLGTMADGATADTGTLTGASWSIDSSSIAFTGTTGTISLGQELTSTGSGYPVGANIIGSSVSTPLVISNPFTVSGTGATLTFVGTGVYGAFDGSKDGPALNNDGDALVVGNLYFNSTDNEMRIYGGSTWIAATSAGSTSLIIYKYVASGSQTTFTGSDANGATLAYTASNINVFLNGVRLDATDYTASNGTSVVLGAGATASDELVVTAYKSFTTSDMVSASAGGTFSGNVTHNGNVIMATNKKVQQKGAFMQNSVHQSWVMGG